MKTRENQKVGPKISKRTKMCKRIDTILWTSLLLSVLTDSPPQTYVADHVVAVQRTAQKLNVTWRHCLGIDSLTDILVLRGVISRLQYSYYQSWAPKKNTARLEFLDRFKNMPDWKFEDKNILGKHG